MATVQKWGHSLGIRLPKAVANQMGLREGSQIEFDTKGGILTIRRKHLSRYTLAGLLNASKAPRIVSLIATGRVKGKSPEPASEHLS